MVKRYIVDEVMDGYAGRVVTATHDKGGEFVKYEDYAALQAENERMKAQRVDLEQFRRLAELGLTFGHGSIRRAEAERLLALIDGKGEEE